MVADRASHPQPGAVYAGKYLVDRELGRGGMGAVYACQHLHLEVPVAVKVISATTVAPAQVRRLLREAQATVRLRSPHAVRLLDADVLDCGQAYLAMELLEGETLSHLLQREGPLPASLAVALAVQVCEVLEEAAGLGILHRDLKPENLFVVGRGAERSIKVLDFGISKMLDSEGPQTLTASDTVLGSPPYMSPEQLRGSHRLDSRTDLWSLGVVLYEMLTGQRPFVGRTPFELCENIVHSRPVPFSERGAPVSVRLGAVVLRCLEKDRDCRFDSARAVAEALQRAISGVSDESVARARSDTTTPVLITPVEVKRSSSLTSLAPRPLLGLVAVAALGVAGVGLTRGTLGEAVPAAPDPALASSASGSTNRSTPPRESAGAAMAEAPQGSHADLSLSQRSSVSTQTTQLAPFDERMKTRPAASAAVSASSGSAESAVPRSARPAASAAVSASSGSTAPPQTVRGEPSGKGALPPVDWALDLGVPGKRSRQ